MDFRNLLKRANLSAVEGYLLYGGESSERMSDKTYNERLTEARRRAKDFFNARFTDVREHDERLMLVLQLFITPRAGAQQHCRAP